MIEFKLVVTADDRLLKAVETLASVLNPSFLPETKPTVSNITTNISVSEGVKAVEVASAVEKTLKGEKAEKGKPAKQDPVQEEAPATEVENSADAEPEKTAPATEAEEVSHNLKIEDLRVVASKLAGQGKQADLKAIFAKFEDAEGNVVSKLSAIQVKDYPEVLEALKEAAGE